jgi:hypothetical protein
MTDTNCNGPKDSRGYLINPQAQFYSSGVPGKQKGGNAVLSGNGVGKIRVMPQKFGYADGTSMFARARSVYTKDAGGGQAYHDSSSYIALKRNNAIGKSSTQTAITPDGINNFPSTCDISKHPNGCLAFKSNQGNRNSVKSAVAKMRAGGCVAPAKKGAIRPPNKSFKSGGGCC